MSDGPQKLLATITPPLTELLAAITVVSMQTVIQTPTFLADAKAAGLDDTELAEIAAAQVAPERSGSEARARASQAGIGS